LQLLGTVKKLLGVCADFALYMQNLRTSGTEDFNEEVARYSAVVAQWLDAVYLALRMWYLYQLIVRKIKI
jgi:hypothetical protein